MTRPRKRDVERAKRFKREGEERRRRLHSTLEGRAVQFMTVGNVRTYSAPQVTIP